MSEVAPAIVIDSGTGMMKGGIAGEDAPKSCFPTLLGRPSLGQLIGTEEREVFLGYEAKEKRQVLQLSRPVSEGNVADWDDMIKVWNYLYYTELKVDPTEQPVHLAETAKPAAGSREKLMQIMFEDFSVPAFYVSMQSVLSLFSSGKTVGLVLDSGEGITSVVPVYEAYSLNHAVMAVRVAGKDLTSYMTRLLTESGVNLGEAHMVSETARQVKEQAAFVSADFEDEVRAYEQGDGRLVDYLLPDGSRATLGNSLFRCPEALFHPSILKKDFGGVHQACYSAVQKCDPDLRRELFGNILLAGGSTMFPGFADRLSKEVSSLAPSSVKVKVAAPDERKYTAWIGGSILSTLATFQTMWVLRQEYDEVGSSVVHRKCI